MTHIMLDLETWGTRPGSALRSIGAVVFDPKTDYIGEEFYANITDESCKVHGMVQDESTIKWWADQGEAAQQSLLTGQLHFTEVVTKFTNFWYDQRAHIVWSQGSNFDVVLWEAATRLVGREAPWKFYNTRDTRTAYELGGLNTKSILREGTHHNALDDAKHQARCVQRAYSMVSRVS